MDGSIETIVRASGYIQSAFYANNTEYGYKIHDALSGSMHDHALQFKADLDIAGTANTMVKHEFVPAEIKYKWSNVTRNTMKLAKKEVKSEDEGKMVSPVCCSPRVLRDPVFPGAWFRERRVLTKHVELVGQRGGTSLDRQQGGAQQVR